MCELCHTYAHPGVQIEAFVDALRVQNGVHLTEVLVDHARSPRVVVEKDTARWRHKGAVCVPALVELGAVEVVLWSDVAAAVKLKDVAGGQNKHTTVSFAVNKYTFLLYSCLRNNIVRLHS